MRERATERRGETSRKILKVMSILTGVESLGLLCSIIKMKIVAVWLDAIGVGLFNIFNTTIETATYFTGLGLRQSAVRDLSLSAKEGRKSLMRMIERLRSWSLVAGLLGGAVLLAFSRPLSEIIFGSPDMWCGFALLSLTMFLNAIYNGETAIFQATQDFRRLARTGVEMSVAGLLLSIPMFRWLGDGSVVLSIVAYSVAGVVFAIINRNKEFADAGISRSALKGNIDFVKFGVWLSATAFISSLCMLIFSGWLNRVASTTEVGFYAAGTTLVVRYTSLIFNSVALEYYPRISANITTMRRVEVFMNHEIVLLLLLFTPLMLLFMIFREPIVRILYSSEFLEVIPFITWGIVTVILRAVSNTMAYTILAKGEGKVYLLTDSFDALLGLFLSILFYNIMGLTGVGVAMIIWYAVYMLVVGIVCRLRYGLHLRRSAVTVIFSAIITAAAGLLAVNMLRPLTAGLILMIPVIGFLICFLRLFHRRR